MNIATRIRLLGPALVLVTALLVGLATLWGYRTVVSEERIDGLTARVSSDADRVELALQQFQGDVVFLARLSSVHRYAAALLGADVAAEEAAREAVTDVFSSLVETRHGYDQIRLIGVADGGRELIRVERKGSDAAEVGDDALQRKGGHDYFDAALNSPHGSIYISKISLNREHGAVEVPHRPMLRAAVPIYLDPDEAFGFVIINLDFESFLNRLLPLDDGFDYYFTNARGDYLAHPDPSRTFGFDLGTRHRIQEEFETLSTMFDVAPPAVVAVRWEHANRREEQLLVARRVHPFFTEPSRSYILALEASSEAIHVSSLWVGTRVLGVLLVLLVLAAAAAYGFASRLSAPLRELTRVAGRVTSERDIEFPASERADEIGTLSRALGHMVESLRKNEDSLREANRDLEYFSRIASHDLVEPARRVAALANLAEVEAPAVLPPGGREVLTRLRAEGLNMVDQLTELRAFARLGQGSLTRQPTDMRALVADVVAAQEDALRRRCVAVVVETMPEVEAYAQLVRLLYDNLLDNALRHAVRDGFELKFTCERRREGLVFGVSNTDSTIDGDESRLFEPFHRASGNEQTVGVGLSICRRIVERHAGRIWVERDASFVHFRFTLTEARP